MRSMIDTEGTPRGRKTASSMYYKMTPTAQKTLGELRRKRKKMKLRNPAARPAQSSAAATGVGRFSVGGSRNK